MTCANQAIAGAKRKLESEMETLHADLDEMVSEASLSEEKCKKAMIDAARLADELRAEQELALNFERDRKLLECQVKDMGARLDEAETNALKGGKKAMLKMETRIRELESEVDAENRRMADAQKNLRKSERRIKEMTYGSDEDRKNHERCKVLLINCKAKSSHTRSKLRKPKKLLPLIWLSIAMPMLSWLMLRNVLNSKSKNWQSQELRAVAHHNLCKKHASKCQNHQHFLHFCHKNACLSKLQGHR